MLGIDLWAVGEVDVKTSLAERLAIFSQFNFKQNTPDELFSRKRRIKLRTDFYVYRQSEPFV
jgi:hypothetical protein